MRIADLVGYPAIVLAFLSHHLIAGTRWEPEITFTLAAIGTALAIPRLIFPRKMPHLS